MSPRPQIRLFTPHPNNTCTRLHMTQSVTILFIDAPPTITLPKPPTYTVLHDVALSSLLSLDFISANVHDEAPQAKTKLTGISLNARVSHTLSATILPASLLVTTPHSAISTIGLNTVPAPKHTRTHGLPPLISVPLTNPKKLTRQTWALSSERLGTTDVALSCGSALIKPPKDVQCTTKEVVQSSDTFETLVPDAAAIIESATLDDTLLFLDHIQALSARAPIALPLVTMMDDAQPVHRIVYNGLCNADLTGAAVDCAKRAVADGAPWAVVLARAPPADAVWKGAQARTGELGFSLDAAEIFIVLKSKVVVAQLRPPCDAV